VETEPHPPTWTLERFQTFIREAFGAKDAARGMAGTFLWFTAEVGELAEALRLPASREETAKEFADVLAWLATLANIAGIDLNAAIELKYGRGCPVCERVPCACPPAAKP
jgi:NTP pyrophosphatase (non-canonical NTP hydrolase)